MSNHNGFVKSDHSDVVALVQAMGASIACRRVSAPVSPKWLKKKGEKKKK